MFSMKGLGKRVDLNHVKEKLSRDIKKFSEDETRNLLNSLIEKGLIEEVKGLYGVTKNGMEFFSKRLEEVEKELRKINESWVIVYKAKRYYPFIVNTIFEFCKDRYVGFYCLFTEKRFFRRDFKGKKIVLTSPRDLLFFINIHCIDIIPCVHRIGIDRPDWLVVDIDPGQKIDFEKTKEVAEITYKIFEKFDLNPAIKFSGSRGFQVWALIGEFKFPEEYEPLALKGKTKRERNYFTLFSDFVRAIQSEVDKEMPKVTTSETLSKQEREDKILLDSSSMKPMGLVRAPYSVHSKTGLVSLPLNLKEIKNFDFEEAKTEKVLERYEKKGNEFILKPSDPKKLIQELI